MNKSAIAALIVAALGMMLARRSFGASADDPYYSSNDGFYSGDYSESEDIAPARVDPTYWFISPEIENMQSIANIQAGSENQRILAFLALIREFESNDDYNVIYGGSHFSDMTDHPRRRIPINLPGYENKFSSAAGAYQFISKTWDAIANRLGLTDFSPASQDAAAIELLREIGALQHIKTGEFDKAMRIASGQWASLPYSRAKQNPKSIVAANEFLNRYMGSIA